MEAYDKAVVKARLLPHKGLQNGCTRITLEVPAEYSLHVVDALGWPSPSNEIWVAVARLNNESEAT